MSRGIDGHMTDWIRSFFTCQRADVSMVFSSQCMVLRISALLWDPCSACCKCMKCSMKMFADDTKIWNVISRRL